VDLSARNQYLQTLLKERGYHIRTKKEKSVVLDEYCQMTNQNRKHVIAKIRSGDYLRTERRQPDFVKPRPEIYDGAVKVALSQCWQIFDQPCGERLAPLLRAEVDRLRRFSELDCTDEVAEKLKRVSARTIDTKLTHEKEVCHLKARYGQLKNPLLYEKVPIKLSDEWDREKVGQHQLDIVEHCGQSPRGEFVCTLSETDIATGWWEGAAQMGKSQRATFVSLQATGTRFPWLRTDLHIDNGAEVLNWHLVRFAEDPKNHLHLSRSRPLKKNDNCFVEQKNSTHVRQIVGHLRYETEAELKLIQSLYRLELRLYKNFFQTTIKLKEKTRVKGKIHRRYDTPKTPYQRALESPEVSEEQKTELRATYASLNPAALKRQIDRKCALLYRLYQDRHQPRQPLEEPNIRKEASKRWLENQIAEPALQIPISVR